jgi:GNAT superfamily N-acetyltransferase
MIIGMINLLITISTAEGGFVLVLEDLVVNREHRGNGYGSRLLQHAIGFAREKKFLRITLLTDNSADTPGFYLKHGFVESEMKPMRYFVDHES